MTEPGMILIVYTTRYRKGGARFARVARTLRAELAQRSNQEICCKAIESKASFKALLAGITEGGKRLSQLHFIGHSGMYGPMFGTVAYPEQFSPWEIAQLRVPWASGAKAYFHCCRSARWFAPYFARVQEVPSYGYHWYTAFSARPDHLRPDFSQDPDKPLYCFGCIGRKSHGLAGSLRKYLGVAAEPLQEFLPGMQVDRSYDEVASLYNAVFEDIKVRADEWRWLSTRLQGLDKPRVLDLGCGNGALLRALSEQISEGIGLDQSAAILQHARANNRELTQLRFELVDGPQLPCPDASVDVVISLLSFRYLDWDPILLEIDRVLAPGGRVLIIDMVTAPVRWREFPHFLRSKLMLYLRRPSHPAYQRALQKLVQHPAWQQMLRYNPIRSEHEMKWYLESRFPGRRAEVINIGLHSRILAFDSGPVTQIAHAPLRYP